MSVHALKPTFTDRQTYLAWRTSWKTVYSHISNEIRRRKIEVKNAQRVWYKASDTEVAKMQRNLVLQRGDARKMMTLLGEAKLRKEKIAAMRKSIADQVATFPLTITTKVADFHFNKISVEMSFMPKWVLRANGKTYYIEHLDAQMGFSTRELESGSTLGMLRFRNCSITIDETNTATITAKASKLALVA